MAHSTPGRMWLVTYEMRDPIGRIVVEVDSLWHLRRNAFIREREINGDPADHGMVAWVATVTIADAPRAVPPPGAAVRAPRRKDPSAPPRHSPLRPEQVREIRRRHAAGDGGYRVLAREYGVSKSTIGAIVTGRNFGRI